MHALQLVMDQIEGLRSDIDNLSERMSSNPLKLGLVLDINPFWLAAYTLSEAGLSQDLMREIPFRAFGDFFQSWGVVENLYSPRGAMDFGRRHASSDDWTKWIFGPRNPNYTPFLIKLISRPIDQDNPELFAARTQLAALAQEAPFPALVETRPLPRLVASPGDGLQAVSGTKGTLGGFLKDQLSGQIFATTCGHVVTSGSVLAMGQPLGPCVHAQPPLPLPSGAQCYAQCSHKARLDLALISVAIGTGQNTATSIANVIYSNDLVEMDGATSKHQQYRVGGVTITYEVGGCCWDGAFELRPIIRPGVVPAGIQMALATPPNNGDSGAWVIRNTNEWCGVVVAADQLFGYALPADGTLTEASAAFGLQLALA